MTLPEKYLIDRIRSDIEYYSDGVRESISDKTALHNAKLTVLADEAYECAVRLARLEKFSDARTMIAISGNAEAYNLELSNYPADDVEIEIVIPTVSETFFRPSIGPKSSSTPAHWLKAFYLSLIWGENPIIDPLLMGITTETLRESSTQANTYRYKQVDAAKALYKSAEDEHGKIADLLKSIQPDMLAKEDKSFAAHVAMHEGGLMAMIAQRDSDGFNNEVEKALESHEKYYSKSEKLRNSAGAWLSLPALGLCALALRRGMTVTVQSPYIPLRLIN